MIMKRRKFIGITSAGSAALAANLIIPAFGQERNPD